MIEWIIALAGLVGGAVMAFLAGSYRRKAREAEKRADRAEKAAKRKEGIRRDVETMDDEALVDRLSGR